MGWRGGYGIGGRGGAWNGVEGGGELHLIRTERRHHLQPLELGLNIWDGWECSELRLLILIDLHDGERLLLNLLRRRLSESAPLSLRGGELSQPSEEDVFSRAERGVRADSASVADAQPVELLEAHVAHALTLTPARIRSRRERLLLAAFADLEKRELISDIWGKRGATYGEKGVCRRITS